MCRLLGSLSILSQLPQARAPSQERRRDRGLSILSQLPRLPEYLPEEPEALLRLSILSQLPPGGGVRGRRVRPDLAAFNSFSVVSATYYYRDDPWGYSASNFQFFLSCLRPMGAWGGLSRRAAFNSFSVVSDKPTEGNNALSILSQLPRYLLEISIAPDGNPALKIFQFFPSCLQLRSSAHPRLFRSLLSILSQLPPPGQVTS